MRHLVMLALLLSLLATLRSLLRVRTELALEILALRQQLAALHRILESYFAYYHKSRTHLSLGKDAPESRAVQPPSMGRIAGCLKSVAFTTATSAELPDRDP